MEDVLSQKTPRAVWDTDAAERGDASNDIKSLPAVQMSYKRINGVIVLEEHTICVSMTPRTAQKKPKYLYDKTGNGNTYILKNPTNTAKRFRRFHEVVFQPYPHRGTARKVSRGHFLHLRVTGRDLRGPITSRECRIMFGWRRRNIFDKQSNRKI